MTKRKTRKQAQTLFNSLCEIANQRELDEAPTVILPGAMPGNSAFSAPLKAARKSGELVRMKKFRFQLLHQWLVEHFEPCRVADVGGGKGLLTCLLQESGWDAAVIDPVEQPLPDKYKDITHNKRIKIPPTAKIPRISQEFEPFMAQQYDLLIGMHAHGCNIKIIEASVEFQRRFILLPCCIIDEPLIPPPGVHWLECLVDYAVEKGFVVRPFRLNFRGQNIGFYATPGKTARNS